MLAQDYTVTSGQRDRSPPSLSLLCGHPRRLNTIPGTASPSPTLWGYGATRRRHAGCCMPYSLPSAAPSSQCMDNDSTEDFNTSPSKPLLGGHRACHDAPSEARFARTTCRMDLPGPTTSVGTKTDYSVGPWDYPTCAARHLLA
jgi:hypothetical protein